MLKGKTIQSVADDINSCGIRNTVVSEAPKTLVPRKILNDVAGYLPDEIQCYTSSDYPIKKTYYAKSIVSSTSDSVEVIKETKNLRYSLQELKDKFPGFANLYYVEIFDLLQTLDYNLTPENLNTNLLKFMHLGNNIQAQISRLNETLEFVSPYSFKQVKNDFDEKIGFFTSQEELIKIFDDFNDGVFNYYAYLITEVQKIKNFSFEKYNLVNLYFDFFSFIADELQRKNIATNENVGISTIASRVISLNNSKTVLNQFKNLIKIEEQGKDLELNNVKDYLDTLKPSLYLLQQQNFKQFKEKFKELLKK